MCAHSHTRLHAFVCFTGLESKPKWVEDVFKICKQSTVYFYILIPPTVSTYPISTSWVYTSAGKPIACVQGKGTQSPPCQHAAILPHAPSPGVDACWALPLLAAWLPHPEHAGAHPISPHPEHADAQYACLDFHACALRTSALCRTEGASAECTCPVIWACMLDTSAVSWHSV